MIDLELDPSVINRLKMYRAVSEHMMRPISREYDEREHEKPTQFYESMWSASAMSDVQVGDNKSANKKSGDKPSSDADAAPRLRNLYTVLSTEELCWGDAGLFLATPNSGLGGAAVMAAGAPAQKERFLKRFRSGKPKWGAMAITEPGFGSDSSAVTTTATRGGDHWVTNGTKIFPNAGEGAAEKPEGFGVVWATVDKRTARPGTNPLGAAPQPPGVTGG